MSCVCRIGQIRVQYRGADGAGGHGAAAGSDGSRPTTLGTSLPSAPSLRDFALPETRQSGDAPGQSPSSDSRVNATPSAASRCSNGLNASGTLDRCLEAAEPPADRLLRRTHSGRRPTLGGREPTVDLNELEQGPNCVFNPRIGHVVESHGLPVEYSGRVRIVGT